VLRNRSLEQVSGSMIRARRVGGIIDRNVDSNKEMADGQGNPKTQRRKYGY